MNILLIILCILLTWFTLSIFFPSKTFKHKCKNGLIITSNIKCPDCGKDWKSDGGIMEGKMFKGGQNSPPDPSTRPGPPQCHPFKKIK